MGHVATVTWGAVDKSAAESVDIDEDGHSSHGPEADTTIEATSETMDILEAASART